MPEPQKQRNKPKLSIVKGAEVVPNKVEGLLLLRASGVAFTSDPLVNWGGAQGQPRRMCSERVGTPPSHGSPGAEEKVSKLEAQTVELQVLKSSNDDLQIQLQRLTSQNQAGTFQERCVLDTSLKALPVDHGRDSSTQDPG